VAGDRCELQPEVGPCRGSFRRWYHDTAMRKCLPFTYGGCRGNANRFETEYQCTAACVLGGDREPAPSRDLRTSTTATRYRATLTPARRDREYSDPIGYNQWRKSGWNSGGRRGGFRRLAMGRVWGVGNRSHRRRGLGIGPSPKFF